jgi:membrane protease YdiL (CAAX protease family)
MEPGDVVSPFRRVGRILQERLVERQRTAESVFTQVELPVSPIGLAQLPPALSEPEAVPGHVLELLLQRLVQVGARPMAVRRMTRNVIRRITGRAGWQIVGVGIPLFALVNAFSEEVVYRGVLQETLLATLGTTSVSVLLQADAFAVEHFARGFAMVLVQTRPRPSRDQAGTAQSYAQLLPRR